MKAIRVILLLLLGAFTTFGQAPELINYQGRLLDGAALAQGEFLVVFRLFTTPVGGVDIYTETQTVSVLDGLYSTMIGVSNPVSGSLESALTSDPVYLEVEVDGTPMTPRERMVSVAHALHARESDPHFSTSAVAAVSAVDIQDWHDAYTWGDHAGAGYAGAAETAAATTALWSAHALDVVNLGTASNSIRTDVAINAVNIADNGTQISILQTSKVSKTGDTMTGPLTVNHDVSVTGSISLGGELRSTWPSELPISSIVLSEAEDNAYLTDSGFTLVRIPTSATPSTAWSLANASPSWSRRWAHRVVVHEGKMWVLGGQEQGWAYKNDVWYSTDGATWTSATSDAGWLPRSGHTAVAYDGKMWIMGGYQTGLYLNDVWYSADGTNWSMATNAAAWYARDRHASVAYDGKLWVMGGWGSSGGLAHDVWYSTNGSDWVAATTNAAWSKRHTHQVVVHDGEMWLLGGGYGPDNDVWSSTNGVSWTLATNSAAWTPRGNHAATSHDGKLWVFGGDTGGALYTNDAWYSSDGAHWTIATNTAPWTPRYSHRAVSYDNKAWIMGGYLVFSIFTNDVWSTWDITDQPDKLGNFYLFEKQ